MFQTICKKFIFMALVISFIMTFTACGEAVPQPSQTEQPSVAGESATVTPAVSPSPTPEITGKDTVKTDGTTDFDKLMMHLGINLDTFETQAKSMEDVPANTIIVGAMTYEYEFIYETIAGFNKAQSEYKAEVKRYENKDSMILDVVRGEGCDVLVLSGSYLNVLGNKTALEEYDFVGFPNLTGEPEYQCSDALEPLYCINTASKKKDISWKLIEYMLSEECQMAIYNDNTMSKYPARRDVLEQALQEEVDKEPDNRRYQSFYTEGWVLDSVEDFTEEDKEYLLHILDHVGGSNGASGEFSLIVNEELRAFWSEGQSAEVTAHNIQNRMTLLLMEQE